MKLLDNWDDVLKRAWSVRFNIIGAASSAALVAVQAFAPFVTADNVWWFMGALFLANAGALISRLLTQDNLPDQNKLPD